MLQSRWKAVDREYLDSIPHYLKKMCTVHHHIKDIKEDLPDQSRTVIWAEGTGSPANETVFVSLARI